MFEMGKMSFVTLPGIYNMTFDRKVLHPYCQNSNSVLTSVLGFTQHLTSFHYHKTMKPLTWHFRRHTKDCCSMTETMVHASFCYASLLLTLTNVTFIHLSNRSFFISRDNAGHHWWYGTWIRSVKHRFILVRIVTMVTTKWLVIFYFLNQPRWQISHKFLWGKLYQIFIYLFIFLKSSFWFKSANFARSKQPRSITNF